MRACYKMIKRNTIFINIKNGIWLNLFYYYKCIIFLGVHCERQDYCASSPCRNSAECHSLADNYRCTCATGFTGPNCADDIDECDFEPCVHGTCQNIHGSYK